MVMGSADFRALQRASRRRTALLILAITAIYAVMGLWLDLRVGTFALAEGMPFFTTAALLLAGLQSLIAYFGGGALVLRSVGARPLDPRRFDEKVVLDVIDEMAVAARLPAPRGYVMESSALNAFAAGRDPEHAVICVTRGLIENFDREQLQGVIGHETGHICDRDTRVMTMLAVLVGGVALLADLMNRWLWHTRIEEERADEDRQGTPSSGPLALLGIILALLAPLICRMIALAVSRQREYLADARSVEFTRNPRALLRALENIATAKKSLDQAPRATAHLFIVNPLNPLSDDDEGFFDNLFSTHPPLKRRIERLRAMLGEQTQTA